MKYKFFFWGITICLTSLTNAANSDSLQQNELKELHELLLEGNYLTLLGGSSPFYQEAAHPFTQYKINSKHNNKAAGFMSFVANLLKAVVDLAYPVWGTYSEGGPDEQRLPPLTTFNRDNDIKSYKDTIIFNIINRRYNYDKIYRNIYSNAIGASIGSCGNFEADNHLICQFATRAKDAAFIYLIGLDTTGQLLDTIATSGIKSRLFFYNQVKTITQNYESNVASFSGKRNQVYRAKENIMIIQAFDYMRLSKWTGGGDFNADDEKRMIETVFQITYQLYSLANNTLSGLEGGALTDAIHNNMTLVVAAAVGMGAIVIHDRGTYLWAIQRKPERWANAANAYINHVMWNTDEPLGERALDKGAGYAEGPHYARFAFEALLPYFQSFKNFTGSSVRTFGPYYKNALSFRKEYIANYFADPDYLKIYDWYVNIKMPNGSEPTIDDTWMNARFGGIALSGQKRHSRVFDPTDELDLSLTLKEDYLSIFNYPESTLKMQEIYENKNSGDLIVRINKDSSYKNQHYIHLNAERGTAMNGGDPEKYNIFGFKFSTGHEHGDVTSVIISAGDDVLSVDPALYGDADWKNFEINQGNQHNVITVNGNGPDPRQGAKTSGIMVQPVALPNDPYIFMYATTDKLLFGTIPTLYKTSISRQIEVYRTDPPYYVINDYVTNVGNITRNNDASPSQDIQFNWNGNGLHAVTNSSADLDGTNSALWQYPCQKDLYPADNWKMRATLTAISPGKTISNDVILDEVAKNGNSNTPFHSAIPGNSPSDGVVCHLQVGSFGEHSRMTKSVTIDSGQTVHFKTTVQVFPCPDMVMKRPLMKKSDTYTSHLMSMNSGKLLNLHFSRTQTSTLPDTSINAFNIDPSAILETDAKNVFFSYSTDRAFPSGRCMSYTNFRRIRMEDGTLLRYHDTTYIKSTEIVTAYYSLIGKNKYSVYTNASSGCTVKFFLPDVGIGTQMKVKGLSYTYNSDSCIISVQIPASMFQFEIELSDPCLVSCYFPSTIETIDSTFNFDDGTNQTLGHKLDIVQPHGNLIISNGSQMEIRCNRYLRNRDSLILQSDGGDFNFQPCDSIGTQYKSGMGSAIIVNNGSALVLDSGSHTYIGNNAAILVKSGGSLVIKDSAFVEVGDGSLSGKGNIIVEWGGFVHFERGAHVQFKKIIGDTVDKNLIFFQLLPSYHTALAGVNGNVSPLLIADTILHAGFTTIPICDLDSILSPAVKNNDWGYANFMHPAPKIRLRSDTLCPGEPLVVDLRRILNDNRFWFEVCRMDSVRRYNTHGTLYWMDTCIIDTMTHDTVLTDPVCISPRATPDYFIYRFKTSSRHRLTFKVFNDCGINIDSIRYIYVLAPPQFNISIPHTACAGVGTVEVPSTGTFRGHYAWDVNIIDTSGGMPFIYNKNQKGNLSYHEEYTGLIQNTFDFPGFNFLGGRKYLVSLTAKNNCGSFTKYDTLSIPAGAYIQLERPVAYAQPVSGAVSVKLHGYVSLSDSFRWQPTLYLDHPANLAPTSTPLDSITYILISHSGSCVASDTAIIKYNRFANAGFNDTLCFDSNTTSTEIAIGFPYDMSLFLGILYYYDPTSFMSSYNTYNFSSNPAYFRYFTHFMHHPTFVDGVSRCPVNLYDLFTTSINKQLFFQQSWYKTFYKNFTAFSNNTLPALGDFRTAVNGNSDLKNMLDPLDNWTNIAPCIGDMYTLYNDYVRIHSTEITASWAKITGRDTTMLSSWSNYFIAIDTPKLSSTYILSVITPDYAEIDEITVFVDTTLNPLYGTSMQWDSTAYFENYTAPQSSATAYHWNFGDGTSSTEIHPIHTFPKFDSTYIVCLTATNTCNSYTFCDTVRVDSLHQGMNNKVQKPIKIFTNEKNTNLQAQATISAEKELIKLTNYPNPFDNSTFIDYEIWQNYSNAELRITNVLGQQIISQKLVKPVDKIIIDGSALHDGLYYYSIVIDGAIKQTKSMSVMH